MKNLKENTENIDFYSCIDEKRYTDTFKDIKEGDTLYFVSLNGNIEFEEKITDSIFGSLSSIVIKEDENYNVVPSFTIEEHKVKEKTYPGLVERHYNYMKMHGDKPCGVGTTVSMEPSDYRVDIVLDNDKKIHTGISSYDKIYSFSNCSYVFIHKDILVDALKTYYEKNIEIITKKRDRLNKGIEECQEQLKRI